MRIQALLVGDIRFQWKYGFYFLYFIFTMLYMIILQLMPYAWKDKASMVLVFSDPAAIGLFFMGAIILLEKSEQTLQSIAISPVKPYEYVLAKTGAIAFLSTLVGFSIRLSAMSIDNSILFFLGIFLGSSLFSAIGLMVATRSKTLNQFIIFTIPIEIVINLPAFMYLFGWRSFFMLLHPGVCVIELCGNGERWFLAIIILLAWTIGITILAANQMRTFFHSLGGAKL